MRPAAWGLRRQPRLGEARAARRRRPRWRERAGSTTQGGNFVHQRFFQSAVLKKPRNVQILCPLSDGRRGSRAAWIFDDLRTPSACEYPVLKPGRGGGVPPCTCSPSPSVPPALPRLLCPHAGSPLRTRPDELLTQAPKHESRGHTGPARSAPSDLPAPSPPARQIQRPLPHSSL